MGISSMPAPKDSLFIFLLYNTAVSIAVLSNLLRGAMAFLGIPVPGEDGDEHIFAMVGSSASTAAAAGPSLADRFRSSFRPALFGRRAHGAAAADCRVCLASFEPESVVNRLPCGHLFHRDCLEKWLGYDNATCPLCRLRLLPAAADPSPPVAPALIHY
ncbi:probable E3 ubiquitin-protein ligase XERICO [Brachypodium distachyon]|uniref:RING-type domain-containing protein n=1 Tax=Brachypodium distachyon TaxID=15368 RepID=I1I863_BRADI|nr:probable E3 ubiquitin-protein ligase XERICO [Brachypodium distachyon]KQJ98784.1 hypothetical protein BRADI_3g39110v3 [Brachypodium distachyon]|eukprot:XP_003572327.1 probable E3 ubiquitin-protein ligase XERICO [Brachypodium distachyon]